MKLKHFTGIEIREHRQKLGLNQSEFWTHFRTTQSGGSRYESGREIPDPIQLLLNIALGTEAKSAAIVASLRSAVAKRPKKGRAAR